MNKIYSTTIAIVIAVIIAATAWSCSDDDKNDGPVSYEQLPMAAKTFLTEYYGGIPVVNVRSEGKDNSLETTVTLKNGHEIEFNSMGEWNDVEAPAGDVIPFAIIPEPIQAYLVATYPDQGVREISRGYNGYEVKLANGLELKFSPSGEYTGIDR